MNISIEEKKAEAIKRMKAMRIFPDTIKQFEQYGRVSISEPPIGGLSLLEGEDLQRVRDFESEGRNLVYLVIRSYSSVGMVDCYLSVDDYYDDWELDWALMRKSRMRCYAYNHDSPKGSEFGTIGVARTLAAGLVRTW